MPVLPPSADIEALQEPKPAPPVEIVTDAQAEAAYNAEVEGWGDRLSAAGRRVCRWFAAQGVVVRCADR